MLAFYQMGNIGKIELRNWLAEEYPSFKRARRSDVDQHLEEQGLAQLKEQLAAQEFEVDE